MTKTALKISIFCLAFTLTSVALSKEIFYGSGTETVKLVFGTSVIFRFHNQVRTISQAHKFTITPADETNPDYSVLTVIPRFTKGSNKVVFILSDGSTVNVKLTMRPKQKKEFEAFYDFKPNSTLIERSSSKNLPVISEIDLMKAMVRDNTVTGYKKQKLKKWIKSHFKKVNVSLDRIYTGKDYNGYVFSVTNNRKHSSVFIDIKKLTIGHPNLAILSQTDSAILYKNSGKPSKTTIRLVAKSSSSYKEVDLPILLMKNKGE